MAHSKKKTYNIFKRYSNKSQSSKGRDFIIFLLFVCVSSIFWLVSNLNNEIEEDIKIPIEIIGIPDSIKILDELPSSINVTIKDRGTSIVRYILGNNPALKINFLSYVHGDNFSEHFILNSADIETLIKQYFGNIKQIVSINPDSIKINYTSTPCKKCKLQINTDVSPHFQYVVNGEISANIDSVEVYKISDVDTNIVIVNTELIKRVDLKDTTIVTAQIKQVDGYKIIPESVTIIIPVEPLIAKKQSISINSINVPNNIGLILFPHIVEITYLIPMSKYNQPNNIIINADYNYILTNISTKIPLFISNIPEDYKNVELSTDSAEYIIEQK